MIGGIAPFFVNSILYYRCGACNHPIPVSATRSQSTALDYLSLSALKQSLRDMIFCKSTLSIASRMGMFFRKDLNGITIIHSSV
jgi:hypothetical protein